MAERKVINKYIPPDFDPSKLPKRKAPKSSTSDQQKVRTMLPMSVRCATCGNYMAKGTKFNVRMELVKNENYLGMKIFRFYYKCKNCAAEFCMKTDPKSADYVVEAGATRNYEAGKEASKLAEEVRRRKEEEEKGDAMKALENRTLDSKRELEMVNALDEMKALRSRHERVDLETALRRVRERREGGDGEEREGMTREEQLDEADEVEVQMMLLQQERARRIGESASSASSESSESSGDEDAEGTGVGVGGHVGEDGGVAKAVVGNKRPLAKRIKVVATKKVDERNDEEGEGVGEGGGLGCLFGGYGGSDSE